MIFRRNVGEKGQVVIPQDIREMMKIRAGQDIIFEVADNEVKIFPALSAEKTIEDFVSGHKLKKKLSPRELKDIMLEQYDEEIPGH